MKITLLWILLLCTLGAQAYTTSDKDSIDRRKDPYYLQALVGLACSLAYQPQQK